MWEAVPRLYWRVKIDNRWKYVPAEFEELDRYKFVELVGGAMVSAIVRLHWPQIVGYYDEEGNVLDNREDGESDETV